MRGVPPPGDILAILKKAGALSEGGIMRVRLENNPYQLYDLLQQRGCVLMTDRDADGSILATIRANDAKAK